MKFTVKATMLSMKNIIIIGSTGSVGRQALQVIASQPRHFRPLALACRSNIALLEKQISRFKPRFAVVYDKSSAKILQKKLAGKSQTKILAGPEGLKKIATLPGKIKILYANSGLEALDALTASIKAQKEIALANKEMIVAHGAKIMKLARKYKVTIIPVDSEHSAIFQCLQGENPKDIEKIILTCSGGPFLGHTPAQLKNVTAAEALNHPVWKMGKKISVDSATLMNKAFEVIEAMHLFGLRKEQIEIIVHPECAVHSLVQFKDGSVKAQMASPDMRIPIVCALAWPQRVKTALPRLQLQNMQKLTFLNPDLQTFRGPEIARACRKPAALVRANEEAVMKFMAGEIAFDGIYRYIEEKLKKQA
jgi:1-deoxy-D-xylulose-5-phosphate reductoisomerase